MIAELAKRWKATGATVTAIHDIGISRALCELSFLFASISDTGSMRRKSGDKAPGRTAALGCPGRLSASKGSRSHGTLEPSGDAASGVELEIPAAGRVRAQMASFSSARRDLFVHPPRFGKTCSMLNRTLPIGLGVLISGPNEVREKWVVLGALLLLLTAQ
jgi:hypothetical protein